MLSLLSFVISSLFISFCLGSQQLVLNQELSVSLNATDLNQFSLTLPDVIKQDLYIMIEYPKYDLSQQPFVEVQTQEGYAKSCLSFAKEFTGVCVVPNYRLTSKSKIKISIYCYFTCNLSILSKLNKVIPLSIYDSFAINSATMSSTFEIEMQIPSNLVFTQITLLAKIINIQQAESGLQMYANVGQYTNIIPSSDDYDFKSMNFANGQAIALSSTDAAPGDWIKLLIIVSPNVIATLTTWVQNNNKLLVSLGSEYFGFSAAGTQKLLVLNTIKQASAIKNNPISLLFIIYNGKPSIQIAFDQLFNNVLPSLNIMSGTVFTITDHLRSAYKFNGTIYIRINTNWASDYYFKPSIDAGNYQFVQKDLGYYDQLQYDDVQNYFLRDYYAGDEEDRLRSYSVKIQLARGRGTVGLRRCYAAQETNNLASCLLHQASQTQDSNVIKSFGEIDAILKRTETYFYIQFSYDMSKCFWRKGLNSSSACIFQFVWANQQQFPLTFEIEFNEKSLSSTLKESSLKRDFIKKQEYLYYKFIVPRDAESILFYLTLIEGDTYMIGSAIQEFPTLESNITNIIFTSQNSLVFSKSRINSSTTLYLSIYGLQFSQFSLGALVTRKTSDNSTIDTTIELNLDLSQQFSLSKDKKVIKFLLTTPSNDSFTIQIIQISGSVNISLQSNQSSVSCIDTLKTNSKAKCTFIGMPGGQFDLVVAALGESADFVVIFHKTANCLTYIMNSPLYLYLTKQGGECIQYYITKPVGLQFVSTVPLADIFQKTISIRICIQSECFMPVDSHHHQISKNNLLENCKLTNNTIQSCKVRIQAKSNSNQSKQFRIILQQLQKDIELFDGISQRIKTYEMTQKHGRYFYYYVFGDSAIKLYFASSSSSNYYLSIHFVEEDSLKNSTNIYLPYSYFDEADNGMQFTDNIMKTIIYDEDTIYIPSEAINKYCVKCLLAISVYPDSIFENEEKLFQFEIEVTQSQSYLQPGSHKMGYLQEGQIMQMQLSKVSSQAIVTIKDLERQSSIQKDCFEAQLVNEQGETFLIKGGYQMINDWESSYRVLIKSVFKLCKYQIFYYEMSKPVSKISLNQIASVDLNKASKIYYLYRHYTSSFKISQQIISGSANIAASQINQTSQSLSVKALLNLSFNDFPYRSQMTDLQLIISNGSEGFCQNCGYLILVSSTQAVKQNLVISLQDDQVPLSINTVLKKKAKQNQINSYVIFSSRSFNISINIIYGGPLNLIVVKGKDKVKSQKISQSSIIQIEVTDNNQNYDFDQKQYIIHLQSSAVCFYTVAINKVSITKRIFEDVTSYIILKPNKDYVAQFVNRRLGSNDKDKFYNILISVQVLSQYNQQNSPSDDKIDISISHSSKDGQLPDAIAAQATKSGRAYNLKVPIRIGAYFINMTSNYLAYAYIIVVRNPIFHLSPSQTAIMTKQSSFQLFSPGSGAIIQLFACYGQISIKSSRYYENLQDNRASDPQFYLVQSNFGGHYIIHSSNSYGEYYIDVKQISKKSEQFSYLITYHYYDNPNLYPHKIVELPNRQIQFILDSDQLTFQISAVTVQSSSISQIQNVDVKYIMYINPNKTDLIAYANCRLGRDPSTLQGKIEQQNAIFSLNVTISYKV